VVGKAGKGAGYLHVTAVGFIFSPSMLQCAWILYMYVYTHVCVYGDRNRGRDRDNSAKKRSRSMEKPLTEVGHSYPAFTLVLSSDSSPSCQQESQDW